MKSRFFAKLCLILTLSLLFSSLPVKASSVQDQSKPIFGLTADDVVEKYNQLTDQQKDQVLRSLGNTSVFANSLFGNIFNSTFAVLDDAIQKIGDLFFQANGVIYKLGSSALSWVSRLIDKVFNNDLDDLNISQPVVDDFYKNTRDLNYTSLPFFVNGRCPSSFPANIFNGTLSGYPLDCEYIFNFEGTISYNSYDFLYGLKKSDYSNNNWYRLIVDVDQHLIYFGYYQMNVLADGSLVPSRYSSWGTPYYNTGYGDYYYSINHYDYSYEYYLSSTSSSWASYSSKQYGDYISPPLSFSGSDYLPFLQQYLNTYFSWADSFLLVQNNQGFLLPIQHDSETFSITNNTYYNYIYNIPDQTPLNVTNIVSNTAIDYSPIDNITYYLPDQYNIEQNFSVVNNYYISSGSAITTQGAIDVNLVSPSVIDVRIINPEDLKDQVENNYIDNITRNFNINFGDLNIEPDINIGIDSGLDDIDVTVPTSSSILGNFVGSMPTDLSALIFTFLGFAFIVAVLYHGSN